MTGLEGGDSGKVTPGAIDAAREVVSELSPWMCDAEAWQVELSWRAEILRWIRNALKKEGVQAYVVDGACSISAGARHWLMWPEALDEVERRAQTVQLVKTALGGSNDGGNGGRVQMEQMIEADAALKQTDTEWLDMTKAQLAAPVRKRTLPLVGRHVARASDSLYELAERLKAVAHDESASEDQTHLTHVIYTKLLDVKCALVSGNVQGDAA